jgi:DNA gyrase subunit B
MDIEVHRGGKIHTIGYARGKLRKPAKEEGEAADRGTIVSFKPDAQIFQSVEFDYDYLRERIMELAFLNRGLRISIADDRAGKKEEFCYEGGIVEFVKHINSARNKLHEPFYLNKKTESMEMEISLQYTDTYSDSIYSFVNDIKTVEGGTHVAGFRTALTRAVNDYAKSMKFVKEEHKISGDDAIEGLTAIISVKVPEPQFEGQTKTKLGNSEVRGAVDSVFFDGLKTYFEENPHISKIIMGKIVNSMEAREAAQKAKDLIRRKNVFESSVLPGKLADCSEEDPAKSEIFFVEGDSAGGCFSGDTKVALADGRNLEFREIVQDVSG